MLGPVYVERVDGRAERWTILREGVSISFMEEEDFEGTLVLEKIAAIGKIDEFLDAVDSDDFEEAVSLMRKAGVDEETIEIVLSKMEIADGP